MLLYILNPLWLHSKKKVHTGSIAARNIDTEKTTVYTLCMYYAQKHTRLVKYELNEAKTLPEEQSSVCVSA